MANKEARTRQRTIADMLQEKERERDTERRKQSQKRRGTISLLKKHVLPLMPRSLADCYGLEYVGSLWGSGLGADLTFKPRVDMFNDAVAKRAIGTIDKVVAGLKRGGWSITKVPQATANDYRKDMSIQLAAQRPDGRGVENLTMTFNGIIATERCHLVEKEVIVAATLEHVERRLVVECDDPPAQEPQP